MRSDAIVPAQTVNAWQALSPRWRTALLQLAAAWIGLIALFFADWRAMAGQWWDSSTYNHILLIPPILGWLVAGRRDELLRLNPSGWWPGLIMFAGAGALWLLGEFAGLSIARQLAVVVMAQAALAVLMGPKVVTALLFPIGYMLFLVPMGDELIPFLQTLTAQLTMALLWLAHIPAAIDGVFITTPAGYFEVAEACSGIKFLIAMVAYGALVANVCFLKTSRRALFMVVSVVVPVLANGARAFGTIWIAGWYGIRFASSFDHVFYGWVFFAVVMVLCMAAGWRFFDRPVTTPMIDPEAIAARPVVQWLAAMRLSPRFGMAAMMAITLVFLGWGSVAGSLAAPMPGAIGVPLVPGWHAVAIDAGTPWMPLHGGADRKLRMRFANSAGQTVDIAFALYANQGEGHAAGGFGQGAMPIGTRWAWERAGPVFDSTFGPARADVIQAPGPEHRLCVTWYRSGALFTGSNLALRLHAMTDHLLLRREITKVLILSASDRVGSDQVNSDQVNSDQAGAIRAFVRAVGPVDRWIDRLSAS